MAASESAASAGAASTRQVIDRENPVTSDENLRPFERRVIYGIGVAFSVFQLWTAAFSPISLQVLCAVHVGFLCLFVYLLFGFSALTERRSIPWYDWLLGVGAFAASFYWWFNETELQSTRSGNLNAIDVAVGIATTVLVVEAARRVMGWVLPLICLVFIPYAFLGREMPDFLAHRGYDLNAIIESLVFSLDGIYATPAQVSASFIFLFILFGAFLERAGMVQLFNDISLGLVGHFKGGPAKVAVVSSGFMGMINGSGVANVLTTGQFTIPLMMRFGYRPAFAGAVEATASMGGQIMPPVMGAAAFIMAERVGVPYSDIVVAAILPAILYFASAFWMVHLEAEKRNLVGLPPDQLPSVLKAMRKSWYLLLPLAGLIAILLSGWTPLFAGVVGIGTTIILILAMASMNTFRSQPLRILFWVTLGLLLAVLHQLGLRVEQILMALIFGLALLSLAVKGQRPTLRLVVDSLAVGAKSAIGVGIACALVGILLGMLNLTGLAPKIAGFIVAASQGELLLALLLTMLACIVLGTGIPTTANYIITSSIAAPALEQFGVPILVTHMFCFYFGIMADLTPPVALGALAASSICRTGHMEVGWIATKVALAGFIVPFMWVYDPHLIIESWNGAPADVFNVSYIFLKACLAFVMFGAALMGWLAAGLGLVERVFAFVAACLLVLALPLTDELGFVLAAVLIAVSLYKRRRGGASLVSS